MFEKGVTLQYRIPEQDNWPGDKVNTVINADAVSALQQVPDECVSFACTSPPYWDVVDYGVDGQIGPGEYDHYLKDLLEVWRETYRVLAPNGKLAIVTPIMPIPKSVIGSQHTRHLKNIGADIEASILNEIPGLHRYSFFVWQKQTSVKMFGSYPYPPNIYEDNTIEFINVLVKDGPPPIMPPQAKHASRLSQAEWRNLTMQVWPMYPADVKRAGGHPAPYPVVLPQRLIAMYTFAADPANAFGGDLVLDPFNGAGATCLAAKAAGRNYLGIDLNAEFCDIARQRLMHEQVDPWDIILERVRVRGATNSRQEALFELDGEDDEEFEVDPAFTEG